MKHFPALETERLILRAPRSGDAAGYEELHRDPTAAPFLGDALSASAIVEFTVEFEKDWAINWTIVEKTQGRFVGTIALHEPKSRNPILSYAILKQARRKGLATEAIQAVLAHAATQPQITEVIAHTHLANDASIGLLRKLGFTATGEVDRPAGLRKEFRWKV